MEPAGDGSGKGGTRQYIYLGDPKTLSDTDRVLSYDENGIWQSMRIEKSEMTISRQSISKESTIKPREWDIPKSKRQCR